MWKQFCIRRSIVGVVDVAVGVLVGVGLAVVVVVVVGVGRNGSYKVVFTIMLHLKVAMDLWKKKFLWTKFYFAHPIYAFFLSYDLDGMDWDEIKFK